MHGIVNSQLKKVIYSIMSNNINQPSQDWSIRVSNCILEITTTRFSAPTDSEHVPTYTINNCSIKEPFFGLDIALFIICNMLSHEGFSHNLLQVEGLY